MWIILLSIFIMSFSAFFGAYLAVFYSASFKIATFAKATSMILFLVGMVFLFIAIGWWGLTGIVGYWLLFTLSRVHWYRRFEAHLKAGTDPWHGMIRDKKLSDDDL